MSNVRQFDLFASIKPAPQKTQTNQILQNAINKVEQSKKYQPSVVLPQYDVLRQKIIMVENLVKSGRLQTVDYLKVIRDKEQLKQVVEHIKESKLLAWDTETDNLDPIVARLAGLSFHDPVDNISYYVPMTHCDSRKNILENQVSYEEFVEIAGELFTNPDIKKITHNGVYDMRVIKNNLNIIVKGAYWDTLLFMNAIDENHRGNKLKQLYKEFIDSEDAGETFETLFEGIPFQFVPIDVGYIYAAGDAWKTIRLYEWQLKELSRPEYKKMLQHYLDTEIKQLEIVVAMEERGINLDLEFAKKLEIEYTELLKDIQKDLDALATQYGMAGMNFKSPQQVADLLYNKMKLESVDKKNPTGTGEEIINKLVNKYPENTILKKIVLFRGTSKLLDTYITALPKQLHSRDGKLHGRFNSHGAKTGRYSSDSPNLQNIPARFNKETGKDDSRIRQMFIPSPGYVFISSDFSQIEPRILAYRCDDYFMLDAYNTGKDLYSLMASQIYNVSYEDCLEANGPEAKRRRSSVKGILLGLMYGRSAASIGEELNISKREAENLVKKFFASFPNIEKYIQDTITTGTLLGYVTTIYDRRRRLPDLNHTSEYIRAEAQRQAVNASIQGSSADITKRAMWKIFTNEWLRNHDCHMILTIHDEVVVEVPKDIIYEAGSVIRQCMIDAADMLLEKLPVKCDVEVFETAWNCDNSYKLKF